MGGKFESTESNEDNGKRENLRQSTISLTPNTEYAIVVGSTVPVVLYENRGAQVAAFFISLNFNRGGTPSNIPPTSTLTFTVFTKFSDGRKHIDTLLLQALLAPATGPDNQGLTFSSAGVERISVTVTSSVAGDTGKSAPAFINSIAETFCADCNPPRKCHRQNKCDRDRRH